MPEFPDSAIPEMLIAPGDSPGLLRYTPIGLIL